MNNFKSDFPLLKQTIGSNPLIYMDSSATTPKPSSVLDSLQKHYITNNGNPGRGNHTLSYNTAKSIDSARSYIKNFFDANRNYDIAFTKNSTESINILAQSILFTYKDSLKKPTIIITEAEHHSNMLPWIRLQKQFNFQLKLIDVLPTGEINYNLLQKTLNETKNGLLAITHGSNVTGIQTKLVEILDLAKKNNIEIALDATQTAPHMRISLRNLPVNFLIASAHKLYGPEGVGFLIMRKERALELEPSLLGGGMVREATTYNYYPSQDITKFEAGTLNSAGIVASVTALEYLDNALKNGAFTYEEYLTDYFKQTFKERAPASIHMLADIEKIHLPIFSFYSKEVHSHDIADFFDEKGIAVRAGHHCAQPLHRKLNILSSVRASLSFFNSKDEIDYFFDILDLCMQTFKKR